QRDQRPADPSADRLPADRLPADRLPTAPVCERPPRLAPRAWVSYLVSVLTGSPRIEASSTCAVCATGIDTPCAARGVAICSEHPGLAVMSNRAPVARTVAALRRPSSPAASGWSRLETPAHPPP